jgi:ribosomal protein L24
MKFKVNDNVQVTAGKDKGKHGKITKVFPKEDKVLVEGVNMYVKHIKPPRPVVIRSDENDSAHCKDCNHESDTGKIDRRI